MQPTTNLRLLSYADLKPVKGIPYCASHLWRLWKAGKFPAPLRISTNRTAWLESDIDSWIAARVADRDGGAPQTS